MSSKRDIILLFLLLAFTAGIALFSLITGDVEIPMKKTLDILFGGISENPSWSYIIESRFNRTIAALCGGSALAVAGLILQVYFRNPLAGPGVLGITSGAELGVAFVILGGSSAMQFFGNPGLILAGILGSFSVLALLLFISKFIANPVVMLVLGLMFSAFISAFINVMLVSADLSSTREYVLWGMGSFEGITSINLIWMVCLCLICFIGSLFLIKPMNALVLGEQYALSTGIQLSRVRLLVIFFTGVLSAVVTVYCGPVSFIGIAVPQLVRMILSSKNHLHHLFACILCGAFLAILSDLVVRFTAIALPLNTVTALLGAPVIVYTILKLNNRVA